MPEHDDYALRAAHQWADSLSTLETTVEELTIFIRLARVAAQRNRIDDRTLRQFEASGVRGSQDFRTLALLRRSPEGLTNGDLIELLGGSKAGMSARLSRFTDHGLAERTSSTVDRRSHTNTLTEQGKQLTDQMVTSITTALRVMTADLSPDQMTQLSDALAQIIKSADPGG